MCIHHHNRMNPLSEYFENIIIMHVKCTIYSFNVTVKERNKMTQILFLIEKINKDKRIEEN
jgi:hypothetical protein